MSNRFLSSAIFSGLTTAFATAGEVTTDGSMGAAQTLTGPNYTIGQDLGTTVGNNLFHSFGTFNLNQGDVATFTGADTIQNVISRVTEGNPSSIDGTIQSQVGTANFFFINPAGIIFGQHAAIDVPAAFHASTANELRFADGSSYNLHTSKGSLTAAAPESFGFLGRTGDIVIEGSQLNFKEGTEVSFTGNSVTSNGATIEVPRGSLRVYGNGDAVNNVAINGELPVGNGAITMNGGNWNVNGNGGGDIWISGGEVSVINGAGVFNHNTGNLNANGGIHLEANTLIINGGSAIKSRVYATGNGSLIAIKVRNDMLVINSGVISTSVYDPQATGNAGNIVVNVVHDLQISDSQISSSTSGTGDSGSIAITAGNNMQVLNAGVIATSINETEATGNAGAISINVGNILQILNSGSQIISATFGKGNGGNINVTANNLIIQDENISVISDDTGIISYVGPVATGRSGNTTVTISELAQILKGGLIASLNAGPSTAGNVIIIAHNLIIDGSGGIASLNTSTGKGGAITITVNDDIKMLNGGFVMSQALDTGNGGNITITANNLTINGAGIISSAGLGIANAGDIVLHIANTLSVLPGGIISSDSDSISGTGASGDITITANNLFMEGEENNLATIGASAGNLIGNGGNVTITVNNSINMQDSAWIYTRVSGSGEPGIITIQTKELVINGGSIGANPDASSTSHGRAGNVAVTADTIHISNGGSIQSNTSNENVGGNVIVTANNLTIENSIFGIQSNSYIDATGDGGIVTINVRNNLVVINGSSIASTSYGAGDGGSIKITTKNLFIDSSSSIDSQAIALPSRPKTSNAGDISIIVIENAQINGEISSDNANWGSTGDAGTITLTVGRLLQLVGGKITTEVLADLDSPGTGNGGEIVINASAIALSNGEITTSVDGNGNGGDITLNGGYLVLDTGFIQANTAGNEARGGDIFINMDGVLPNGGVTEVGGDHATFNRNSGRNVIQAAAPGGESGNITITNPSDSSAAGLTGAANRLEPLQIAKNPCIGIKKRASLRRKGRGGLLKSSLKSDLLKTNDYAPNRKDVAHTNRKQRQQEVCAEG